MPAVHRSSPGDLVTTASFAARSPALSTTLAALVALSLLGALLGVALSYHPPVERKPAAAPHQHALPPDAVALA
jgi:hypothetical protein